MKITDIKAFAVDRFRTNWVFVKVYTGEGVTALARQRRNTKKSNWRYKK